MLYSPSMNVGFAHYPKTAGHSLTKLFREVFPDASLIEKHPRYEVNHLSVRCSLERLGLVERCPPSHSSRRRGITRAYVDLVRSLGSWMPAGRERPIGGRTPCLPRIIGVVREPFEMLVSLFEYWRGYDFSEEPSQPLIRCARTGTFHRFLEMAVVEHAVQNYREFFDLDGPASAHTPGCSTSTPSSPRSCKSAVNSVWRFRLAGSVFSTPGRVGTGILVAIGRKPEICCRRSVPIFAGITKKACT